MRWKTLLLIALLALAAAMVLWLRAPSRDWANFPPANLGPWVAYGDSLTEGYGASEGHDYPTLLSQQLGVSIVNKGRSGFTTADGLKHVEEVAALNPRVVLLCLGGNDVLERSSRTVAFENIARIIDRLQEGGAFVVLIGIRSASLRDRNASYFEKLAKTKRVLYVPNMLKDVLARPVYMSDAIHPNDEGYGLIAERLAKILRPLLPRLQGTAGESSTAIPGAAQATVSSAAPR